MRQPPLSTVLRRVGSVVAAREMRSLSDAELLRRFVSKRDETAFAVLMHRHSSMVLGVCRRVVAQAQDAEDACQAAFLILARKAHSIRKTEVLGSWLHGVAYRVSLRLKSKAARQPRSNSSLGDPAQGDTASAVTWQEAMQVLDEELDRLPATYRSPLILCYLEGQTMDEGAKELGWTLGAFRGRLERARDMLRKRLTRRGIEIPVVLFGVGLSSSLASAAATPTLTAATVQAAILMANGQTAIAELISAKVCAIVEGMMLTKLKSAGVVIAVVLAAGASLGLGFTIHTPGEPPAQTPSAVSGTRDSKNPNPPKPQLDAAGDPLPAHAVARLGTERFRLDAWVEHVAVVPGSKHLLMQGSTAIAVVDAATG